MPIKPSQIQTILNRKRSDFQTFDSRTIRDLDIYQSAWQSLSQSPFKELWDWFQQHPGNVGARCLEELSGLTNGIKRCGLKWGNREHSMTWVKQQLTDITTFAVDGSQILPSKDLSIPIALVQIGWFENPHSVTQPYVKDIELDVMTPAELQVRDSSQPIDRLVNIRRFEMEANRLVQYMQQVKDPERCLVFFDGSLVATFADAFEDAIRQAYVKP